MFDRNVYIHIDKYIYRELGENMTDEELRAMIDEFDRDNDGESKLSLLHCPLTTAKKGCGLYCVGS